MLGCIQPMSSPMMKMTLGFDACAWAGDGVPTPDSAIVPAASIVAPSLHPNFERVLISLLFPTEDRHDREPIARTTRRRVRSQKIPLRTALGVFRPAPDDDGR